MLAALAAILAGVYVLIEHVYVSTQTETTLQIADASLAYARTLVEDLGPVRLEAGELRAGDATLSGPAGNALAARVKTVTGFTLTILSPDSAGAPDSRPAPKPAVQVEDRVRDRVLRDGLRFRGVTRGLGRDQVAVYEPLRDASGAVVGMLGAGRDLSTFLRALFPFRLLVGGTFVGLFAFLALLEVLAVRQMRLAEAHSVEITTQNLALERTTAALTNQAAELAQAEADARDARGRAERATHAKSAFLANMSHELRTPLNAVIGYSELIVDELTDRGLGELIPDVERVADAGRNLLALIDDILDLSKIEAGRMEVYPELFDVPELLDEVREASAMLASAHGNRIEVSGEGAGTLCSDRRKIQQILLNLTSNACKYTTDGVVSLEARAEPGRVCFVVRDTGEGIPEEKLATLFEPFTQAHAEASQRKGTGLGLSIVQSLAVLLGGDVDVATQPGQGSTFTVRLPALPAPERSR